MFITAYPERLLTGDRPEPTFLITKPFRTDTVKAIISQALFFDRRASLSPVADDNAGVFTGTIRTLRRPWAGALPTFLGTSNPHAWMRRRCPLPGVRTPAGPVGRSTGAIQRRDAVVSVVKAGPRGGPRTLRAGETRATAIDSGRGQIQIE